MSPSWRSQFGHPRGALGWLVGHAMAIKNNARGAWVRGLLSPGGAHRVLEVGCGPGVDLAALGGQVGSVAGVDVSREMVRQATARTRGRAEVHLAGVDALPFADATFDRVFSVNSVQFWPDLAHGMAEIARVLRPGGRAAIAIQPRNRGASAETTAAWEARLRDTMGAAGLADLRGEWDRRPRVPVVCVIGTRA